MLPRGMRIFGCTRIKRDDGAAFEPVDDIVVQVVFIIGGVPDEDRPLFEAVHAFELPDE
jgi:hypothetical protein